MAVLMAHLQGQVLQGCAATQQPQLSALYGQVGHAQVQVLQPDGLHGADFVIGTWKYSI